MSIIRQEDDLKGLPDDFLARELENPSGQYPQFLVFTELNRRADMRERFAEQQAQAPTNTMAEEMLAKFSGVGQAMPPEMMPPDMGASGMMPPGMGAPQGMPPQEMDMQGMPPEMGPPMDMPMQGMPMQMMRDGGVVGYSNGGNVRAERRKYLIESILGKPALIPANQFTETDLIEMPDEQLEAIFNYRSEYSDPGREGKGDVEDSINLVNRRFGIYGGMTNAEKSDIINRTQDRTRNRKQSRTPSVPVTPPSEGASTLPDATQGSTISFKQRVEEIMPFFNKSDEPEYSDLDRFEAMFEKLNPAPNPDVTRGRALMALGQGLLGAPTFAEGLSAGAGGIGKIYGDDAADQREYNKGRLAAQQALVETRDARAQFAANREFQGRRSAVTAGAQIYGDDVTAARYARSDQADAIQAEIDALVAQLSQGPDAEETNVINSQIARLREKQSSLTGRPRVRNLTVPGNP